MPISWATIIRTVKLIHPNTWKITLCQGKGTQRKMQFLCFSVSGQKARAKAITLVSLFSRQSTFSWNSVLSSCDSMYFYTHFLQSSLLYKFFEQWQKGDDNQWDIVFLTFFLTYSLGKCGIKLCFLGFAQTKSIKQNYLLQKWNYLQFSNH